MVLLWPPINAARGWGPLGEKGDASGCEAPEERSVESTEVREVTPRWRRWLLLAFVPSLGPFPGDPEKKNYAELG